MTQRLQNLPALAADGIQKMLALEESLSKTSLEPALTLLVRIRASQINGCAYCIHMHTTEARHAGESEMRIYMLDAWRDSTLYSPRERAALGWTEVITRLAETGAPDVDYDALKAQFGDAEQVQLTMIIGAINVWNRLNVGFRHVHPAEAEQARAAA